MKLEFSTTEFAIYQFPDSLGLPETFLSEAFAIVKTPDEVSVIASDKLPLTAAKQSLGWRCFRIAGKLEFEMVGVLARISYLLAQANISIFAVSTYNTDYIFIKRDNIELAKKSLQQAGFEIGAFQS